MDLNVGEVLVVGGGIAGLVSANRAAELGHKVAILEKGSDERYRCNSRFSGGTFSICFKDPVVSSPEVLFNAIEARTGGYAKPELAQTIATTAPLAIRWLQAQGAKFIKTNTEKHLSYKTWVLAPPPRVRNGLNWRGQGPDVLLQTLEQRLLERGGKLLRGMRVTRLVMEGGRCTGVEAESPQGPVTLRARAVVVCDGGFQANLDLVRQHIMAQPEKLRQRGAATGCGDGLRMAQEAGAAVLGLDCFYGHPLNIRALEDDNLWPYPYMDVLCSAGIVVDGAGRRFADEGVSGVYIANMIARQPDPLSSHVIYDQGIWEGPGRGALIAPNPFARTAGGLIHEAPDLATLARLIKVPEQNLVDSVTRYNAHQGAGTLGELDPPRRTDRYQPLPIVKAPFYAMPLCVGITYTLGGIAVDGECRVIRESGEAIGGLYAAGATTGGLEGGPIIGYVGGLTKSSSMGYRAAETIARTLAA